MSDKPYAVDDVRALMGLMSPAEWAKEHARRGLPPYRRLGSTTEMLLKAATAALNGSQVLVVGHTPYYSKQLRDQARAMVVRCRPSASGRVLYGPREAREAAGHVLEFYDHYMPRRSHQ